MSPGTQRSVFSVLERPRGPCRSATLQPVSSADPSSGVCQAYQTEDRAFRLHPCDVCDAGREAVNVYANRYAVHVYHDIVASPAHDFLPTSGLAILSRVQIDVQRVRIRMVVEPHSGLPFLRV